MTVLLMSAIGLYAAPIDLTNKVKKLAPGQMLYFDAVNDWLFREIIYPFSVATHLSRPNRCASGSPKPVIISRLPAGS